MAARTLACMPPRLKQCHLQTLLRPPWPPAELSATDAQSASASATISAVVPGAELTLTKEGPAEGMC